MIVGVFGSRGIKVDLEEFMPKEVSRVITYESGEISRAAERWADKNALPNLVIKKSFEKLWGLAPLKLLEVFIEIIDILIIFKMDNSQKVDYAIKYATITQKPTKVYLIKKYKSLPQSPVGDSSLV